MKRYQPSQAALADARRILSTGQRNRIRRAFLAVWEPPVVPDRVAAINAVFHHFAEFYGVSESVVRAAIQTREGVEP